MSQRKTSADARRGRAFGVTPHRLAATLLATTIALSVAPAAQAANPATADGAAAPAAEASVTAAEQILTWTAGNSTDAYTSAPTEAVAGPATIVFENSLATGNTFGMAHTLTFDTSTPGYNHDVDLNIIASPFDAKGGLHTADVTLTPGTYRYFCAIPGHGMMVGEFTVTDDGGSEPGDTTAPTTTVAITGDQDADGQFVGSANVTLTATDADSDIASVEYNLDGAGWTAYTQPLTVTDAGDHTLQYRATDTAGNTSEAQTVTFTVVAEEPEPDPDTTAPTATAEVTGTQDDDGAYVGSATIALSATDTDSDIESIEYNLNGAGWTAYVGPVAVSTAGQHALQYRATDTSGNTSEAQTVSFTVVAEEPEPDPDTTAPTATAEVTGTQDDDGAYVGTATIALTATDTDSDVASVEYNLDGAGWTAYTQPLTVTDAGDHTLQYRATDTAGNTSEAQTVTFTVVAEEPGTDPEPGDECTDVREFVTVGDIVTKVANLEISDGCTINDLIDEDAGYANHGAFVSHVGEITNALKKDGHITGAERASIVSAAARSNVGQ